MDGWHRPVAPRTAAPRTAGELGDIGCPVCGSRSGPKSREAIAIEPFKVFPMGCASKGCGQSVRRFVHMAHFPADYGDAYIRLLCRVRGDWRITAPVVASAWRPSHSFSQQCARRDLPELIGKSTGRSAADPSLSPMAPARTGFEIRAVRSTCRLVETSPPHRSPRSPGSTPIAPDQLKQTLVPAQAQQEHGLPNGIAASQIGMTQIECRRGKQ